MSDTSPPKNGAFWVASGILLSRLVGLVRIRVLAHYFGDSDAGDAFYAAIKIPNFPQNLFGEGVLSASFIPVYASLLAQGEEETAGKVAGVILSIMTLLVSLIVLLGIALTPTMIDLIAPGFTGAKRDLTIQLVQIIFPGTGLLVLSAWCLGILNSHHKFFLSYAAPVLWNVAIIAAVGFSGGTKESVAIYAAWGLVAGSVLQFAVQLPTALSLIPKLRLGISFRLPAVREIVRNFVPVVTGRGVVQFSAYIDNVLASFLPSGAVSALGYAQSIYMLPIGLFGMSISAAELPSMSRAYGRADLHEVLRTRMNAAFRRIAFFVVPSIVGFVALGDVIAGLLFQTGQFDANASLYVWGVLAGSAIGLLATTLGRLYSSAYYSLRDTRTPLKYSIVRVILTTMLGYLMGLRLPMWLGISTAWGTAGLTASAGIAGWIEFLLLRRGLRQRIGHVGIPRSFLLRIWLVAGLCGVLGFAAKSLFSAQHPVLRGATIVSLFALLYFILTALLNVPESRQLATRLTGKLRRIRGKR
jgi:putative peptidoglycan lipid II flippase